MTSPEMVPGVAKAFRGWLAEHDCHLFRMPIDDDLPTCGVAPNDLRRGPFRV